jgi:hypothetical protein
MKHPLRAAMSALSLVLNNSVHSANLRFQNVTTILSFRPRVLDATIRVKIDPRRPKESTDADIGDLRETIATAKPAGPLEFTVTDRYNSLFNTDPQRRTCWINVRPRAVACPVPEAVAQIERLVLWITEKKPAPTVPGFAWTDSTPEELEMLIPKLLSAPDMDPVLATNVATGSPITTIHLAERVAAAELPRDPRADFFLRSMATVSMTVNNLLGHAPTVTEKEMMHGVLLHLAAVLKPASPAPCAAAALIPS